MAKRRVLPFFIPHAGCTHACVFCNQRHIAGQAEPVSPAAVSDAIAHALAAFPSGETAEVAFYGGSFTALPAALQDAYLQAAAPYIASGQICAIRLSTRPDAVDDMAVSRLFAAGVRTVELGAQSMDDAVLHTVQRGHTAADTVRAAGMLRRGGLSPVLQMMTGLPGASEDSDWRSAQAILACRPDAVRIYPTVVLPDTALFDLWKSGQYAPPDADQAAAFCAKLLSLFASAGIPVIRLGLQESPQLAASAVAGAYHPALGAKAYSLWYRTRICSLLRVLLPAARITVLTHPSRVAAAAGYNGENRVFFQRMYGLQQIQFAAFPPSDRASADAIAVSRQDEAADARTRVF